MDIYIYIYSFFFSVSGTRRRSPKRKGRVDPLHLEIEKGGWSRGGVGRTGGGEGVWGG